MPGLLGSKIGMTRIFRQDGICIPVSLIKIDSNEVVHKKTTEKDGYSALVVGYEHLSKPTKTKKFRVIKEFKANDADISTFEKGQNLSVDLFTEGDLIKLSGISKGKGFAGVMKRWNFAGGPASHGSHFHRRSGSVGCRAKPGRIEKGKKMGGHLGVETVTLLDREVVLIDKENNLIGIKGPIPGSVNSLITLTKKIK